MAGERRLDFLWPKSGQYVLDASQIATILCTIAVVVLLFVLFRRGSLGLRIAPWWRARLLQLQGVDAERVALSSWVLSSMLASLAGVLIAPLFAQLVSNDFFALLVGALAASVWAMTSIPRAVVGGLFLGMLQAVLEGYLPTGSVLSTHCGRRCPSWCCSSAAGQAQHPAAPPDHRSAQWGRPSASSVRLPWCDRAWMTLATRIFASTVVVIYGLALCLWVLNGYWLLQVVGGVCLAVIMLSIVLTTGVGGTISLCQGVFAAVGAFATAQLAGQHNVPVLGAMVVGAVIAARGRGGARVGRHPPARHLRGPGHAGLRPVLRRGHGAAHLGVGRQRHPPARRAPPELHRPDQLRVAIAPS